MGQTCYANATIQAFRHCSKFPWMFGEKRFKHLFQQDPSSTTRERQQALTNTFAEVIELLQRCKKGQSVRPADFWAKFNPVVENTGFEHLAMRIAHDSHEFYLCLLDSIHESLSQEVEMKILRAPPATEQETHCIQALETWKQEFQKKYSPLVDLFYGLAHVVVQCKGCGNKTHRWETFSALKATIKQEGDGPATLQEMLREEFKPEEISGYDCEKCRPVRHDATRTVYLWRLPLYVVVVVKRFTPDGRKIHRPVAALEDNGAKPIEFTEFFSDESPERDGALTYQLRSIVDHHGSSGGGHYTAQCRALDTDAWHVYDDETAHPIPHPMFGGSTYMLWFDRVKAKQA